ncbi:MAG: polysaccharide deacetylase family protein [Candidatus Cloacimonetes bacterium]|nr:polysaccharide deacetylase family protein [Candidatus Cloacimonadota bacterium]MCF7869296.1 polysaccharide deacetylase family protein [Candidatus Cloacimonadota bacterium]MCF7884718.1 polysaccharide deacetylase family protein [Candidatus Cloacimonadota bacterium]
MAENIKKAYESVLEEEGVPFRWETHGNLWRQSPEKVLKKSNVLLFPDYLTEQIPYEFSVWVEDFIDLGGNVFIVYNCGTREDNGSYREKAVFTRLLGLNYITYNEYNSLAFQMANIRFKDQQAVDLFEIPCGKMDEEFTLTGYQYGKLSYPVAKVDINFVDNKKVYASSVYEDGKILPNTFHKKQGKGNVLFANIPLGYLKAYGSDDLLIRTFLRVFLFDISHIPYLCNTPLNKGGIVINWHIDNYREIKNINRFEKLGFLRKSLPSSFHITAGDFVNEEGDEMGFDASRHPDLIRKMMQYGAIGSHGGWAHNWFADRLVDNDLSPEEIEYYVKLNSQVLSMITHYDIKEYAAPNGVHPQPLMTRILEKLGFTCYYYPGDSGSRPNRTFSHGKMVSEKVIAFPVMPFHRMVSVQELGWADVSVDRYRKWLDGSLDYVVTNRTIFLCYSHLYDFEDNPQYIESFQDFLDRMEILKGEDKLIVKPMSYFTDFIHKMLQTKYNFILRDNLMVVELSNPQGLEGISVAIPKYLCRKPPGRGFYIEESKDYYYVNITEEVYEKNIICNLR